MSNKTIGPTKPMSDESMSFDELVNSFNEDISEMFKEYDEDTAALRKEVDQLKQGVEAYEQAVEDDCKFWQKIREEHAEIEAMIEEEEREWKKLKVTFGELCVAAAVVISAIRASAAPSIRRFPKLGFGPRRTRGRQ